MWVACSTPFCARPVDRQSAAGVLLVTFEHRITISSRRTHYGTTALGNDQVRSGRTAVSDLSYDRPGHRPFVSDWRVRVCEPCSWRVSPFGHVLDNCQRHVARPIRTGPGRPRYVYAYNTIHYHGARPACSAWGMLRRCGRPDEASLLRKIYAQNMSDAPQSVELNAKRKLRFSMWLFESRHCQRRWVNSEVYQRSIRGY